MQDIIPPHKRPRGHIQPGQRPAGFEMRPQTAYHEVYSRTRIINSTTVYIQEPAYKETVVEESVVRTPLPLSLQFELESLLTDASDTFDSKTSVVESPKPSEPYLAISPEKQMLLNRVRKIIREEQKRAKFRGMFSKQNVVTAMAILFISTTGYVAVDTWLTNNAVKAETAQLSANSDPTADDTTAAQAQEGKEEAQPTQAALRNYSVAPSLPKKLHIDTLNIASRVLPMGVNADGSIQAPRNIYDSGWYSGSVKPGDIGAMFIAAHASGPTREGLFANLDKLVIGDIMQIEKGDGTRLSYKVVHTEIQPLDGLDMKKMLLPYGNALRALNLMTCAGDWVDAANTYNKRVLVWTEQI